MNTNRRFILDEGSRIIDSLNPANSGKGYCHDDSRQDDGRLRESVLMVRLGEIVDKLIINFRSVKKTFDGQEYQPRNVESRSIVLAVFNAVRASHLNSFEPAISIEHRFGGTLIRQKKGIQEFTSLSLFRDDVERLLRDLYGDIEGEPMDNILHAVFRIAEEFTRFVRPDLWREHQDAVVADRVVGIGVPDGCGLNGSAWRRGLSAQIHIEARILEVRANPAGFSAYTIAFVDSLGEPRVCARQAWVETENRSDEADVVPF
jgi:hypothetical protein